MSARVLALSLPAVFSLTLFLSAGLMFFIEPLIGKMILPLFGGTPAVWNTCMMFFQALLLAGYGYAHFISKKATVKGQIFVHLAILLAAFLVLPIAVSRQWAPPGEENPIGYILILLLITIGLPFFLLAANSLLLQKWFADTGHPSAKDPYFLYSASNLGSMLILVGYPTVIEPYYRLVEQSRLWTIGYGGLVIAIALCAWLTLRYISKCKAGPGEDEQTGAACLFDDLPLNLLQRGRWILLAFVPSSLMLGVTTFLSTDVAAIPLFWIIPLSIYLLSFIIVFARVPEMVHRVAVWVMPFSILALITVNYADFDIPKWLIFLFHLVNFFLYSMVCHGEIARSRPATSHLTEFYFWISLGGVLGGIFNALLAPLIFRSILEYPLVLALGALLLPVWKKPTLPALKEWKEVLLYVFVPLVLVPFTYWLITKWPVERLPLESMALLMHVQPVTLTVFFTYAVLALICYGLVFLRKPFLFGIGITIFLMTIVLSKDISRGVVYKERSFFGVLTVVKEWDEEFMELYHGTTLHGKQWLDSDKRFEPLSYYHRNGPVGSVFSEFSGDKKKSRIAVTGLGTGSIAAYVWPGQEIHFYEIDPAVKKIAANPAYFTYLSDSGADWKVILGDARLTMEKAPANYYGIIILDAFSSDAIPVHLLTKEALDLYFSKLQEGGVLLVHISNQYVDLEPVLAQLAREMNLASRIYDDNEEEGDEKYVSSWVILARNEGDLGDLAKNTNWEPPGLQKNVKTWTDDFSNILTVFKW